MTPGMKIHHIGMAVYSIEQTAEFYMGGVELIHALRRFMTPCRM